MVEGTRRPVTTPAAEMIAKLERQPLHDRAIVLSWQTRDEIIDLLRQLVERDGL